MFLILATDCSDFSQKESVLISEICGGHLCLIFEFANIKLFSYESHAFSFT